MDCCIIVSRFNEDISWLNNYKEFKIIIYNKGNKLKKDNFKKIIKLKNVGRESQTWLKHIVENYYNLNDINIFLQGRIDDLGCMAFKNPKDYLKDINQFGFSVSRYALLGPFHWSHNIGIDKDKRYKKQWENKEISRSIVGFRNFAKSIFPKIPILVSTSYGGCFAVKKSNIQKHSLNFYKDLLEILSSHKNPIEGHYMERLWCYMFTKNKTLYKSFRDVLKTKLERLQKKEQSL